MPILRQKNEEVDMGRPKIQIDWKRAEELMVSGCPGTEIADFFGIHHATFYDKAQEHYNMALTAVLAQKRSKGHSLLRHAQFSKALKGDNTLLIWLGKVNLKQRETDAGLEPVNDKLITELITELKGKTIGTKQQTDPQLPASEQAIQHLGGGCSEREDVQLDHKAN